MKDFCLRPKGNHYNTCNLSKIFPRGRDHFVECSQVTIGYSSSPGLK